MNHNIKVQISKLGLSEEEITLYLFIVSKGKKTASQIRREFNWSATKANDLLNSKKIQKLLLHYSDGGKIYFVAKPFKELKSLLEVQKQELKAFDEIINDSTNNLELKIPLDAKVIHYHGLSGLKQVLWNTVKAKDALRFMVYVPNGKFMDFNFYDDIRKIYVQKGIFTKELFNQSSYPAFTKVTEFLNLYEARYLDPKIIRFKHEVLIYNNIYAIYRVDKSGIFCTEIYNQRLADMQKQLYDYLWNRSQKLKIIDSIYGDLALE